MNSQSERMQILELIDRGKISVEEGLRLLETLTGEDPGLEVIDNLPQIEPATVYDRPAVHDSQGAAEYIPVQEPMEEAPANHPARATAGLPDLEKLRQFWVIPLGIGIGILIVGSLMMLAVLQATGSPVLFFFASAPFFFGLAVTALAWEARTAHWMHLRIQQKPGEWPERIAFSFPLPIRMAAWFFRTFRYKIPQLEHTAVDEIILALGSATSPGNPLFLQVDEGEDGEKVQIFIG